ncbi:uncharacterized protein LOC120422645 [Culex pipiens pallens]|uniref:uncharacterized protein LOC120422645 n=1 Tax=Culex pipiens pallens TaxID=42434 RepID=UPI001954C9A7|nr:uncharacterized protein LOC120422645 [Culex pipiens pallens]
MSPHWRVISTLTVIAVMSSVQVHSHPLGTKTFATQNSDDSEFRDKSYDEDFKKVTWVGDVPVPALQKYGNPKSEDNAHKEVDNFPSNIYSKYDNTQKKAKDFFDTKPLLDTIRESDKYGNEGDHFYFITKPLVQITEKVSNSINKVLAAPRNLFRSATKSVSDKLNNVGAGLVGLRK